MDNFGYTRCSQCNEEYVFQDGSKCARCLGLGSLQAEDENAEKKGSSISLDRPAAS